MSVRQPFSSVPHGDFLARAADLEGDEIALFTIAFFMMLERRGPIPDDMQWLGRKAGVSTRRANQIRVKLLDQGKWQLRAEQLGDPAALAIVARANARSAINRSNALERWDRAGQPELDFDKKPDKSRRKRQKTASSGDAIASDVAAPAPEMQSGAKSGEKPEINAGKNEVKDALIPQETAEIRGSDPHFRIPDSRTRATPQLESEEIHTTESESCEPCAMILDAAGFRPRKPELIAKAEATVAEWIRDGIDPEATIIPTIRTVMADAGDDPTSDMIRFDRQIRHAHARSSARPKRGNGAAKVELGPDGPDPRFELIRTALRRDCGGRTYDGWLRPIRFDLDGTELLAELPSTFMADWVLSHFADRIGNEAAHHGFTAVRIFAPTRSGP